MSMTREDACNLAGTLRHLATRVESGEFDCCAFHAEMPSVLIEPHDPVMYRYEHTGEEYIRVEMYRMPDGGTKTQCANIDHLINNARDGE